MTAQAEIIPVSQAQPSEIVVPLHAARELSYGEFLDRIKPFVDHPEIVRELTAHYRERLEAQARREFDAALARAKPNFKPIVKSKQVGYDSKRGGASTQYKHETLDDVLKAVEPALNAQGVTIGYDTAVTGTQIIVTCLLKFQGHHYRTPLPGSADNSGSKNPLQAMGSTLTYLQRYSLKAALGIAASDDDDGRGGADSTDGAASVDKLRELYDCIAQVNADLKRRGIDAQVSNAKVLDKAGVAEFKDIPAKEVPMLIDWIRRFVAKHYPQPAPVDEDMSDYPDIPPDLDRRARR